MRMRLWCGHFDAVGSIGALSGVAGGMRIIRPVWLNSFSWSVVVSEQARNTSLSESASLGLVASTHPRVMSKSAYFICENASWESRQCQLMLEINLRALTNVKAKLEKAWPGLCSGPTEITTAILCQLNNVVFRSGNWRRNDSLWLDVALFDPCNFCEYQNHPQYRAKWFEVLFVYTYLICILCQSRINIYLFMRRRPSSSCAAHVLLVHRWQWAEGLVIGGDCIAHWTTLRRKKKWKDR